ncbi:hypothetical protein [Candidatus Xiphinematobacter sp. Idaho Grape]|uniref:hypothetical protein n=1 Tax=Candidatus Xiphinematobacter sp. Idaho Grape TaxID=1704307 RepID=UPI0007866529|nr:hypothetical protein [Candidatus Xiphinematobacter sp. Idaho Grape]
MTDIIATNYGKGTKIFVSFWIFLIGLREGFFVHGHAMHKAEVPSWFGTNIRINFISSPYDSYGFFAL